MLRTWSERVGALGLLTGTGWSERLEATAAELDRSPAVDLVVAHRDLHDGQLLWDGQRIGVIDLDTVCRAEPALDLANLAVHAALRQAQGVWTIAAADVVREAVAEAARAGKVPQARLGLARRATVARLVAVYSLRPRWRDVVLEWAEEQWTVDVRA
ncbi:phosphotransferase family protein [Serinicoccus profundi]|uniref:phosphotransferase family protein n=1 Tax=Serinicoccus profundi TaxID=1078471 RepID=UPI0011C76BEC|nr:phosphotransferase [Serinicoccus profundi]